MTDESISAVAIALSIAFGFKEAAAQPTQRVSVILRIARSGSLAVDTTESTCRFAYDEVGNIHAKKLVYA